MEQEKDPNWDLWVVILDVLQDQGGSEAGPGWLPPFSSRAILPTIIIAVQKLNDPYGKDFALKQKILNKSLPELGGKLFPPGWPFALKFILLLPYLAYSPFLNLFLKKKII